MKNLMKFSILLALAASVAFAQTATPNTTLCAPMTSTQAYACLTSTTNVVNQTGLYVDNELMLVQLANNQVLAATNANVPVSRSNRSGRGSPTAHANGAVAWLALTPGLSALPGITGFIHGMQLADVGPCTRAAQIYLPRIWVDLGVKRDCNGVWVPYNEWGDPVQGAPFQTLSVNGAITVASGNYVITKAGVLADTLAAPTAGTQDGTLIRIMSTTANAHTLTATGLFQTGTASVNLATFAAQAGAGLVLMAYNGKWIVISSVGITFS